MTDFIIDTNSNETFSSLDKLLSEQVDIEILKNLDYWLDLIKKRSRALSNSLRRCFDNARNSKRYLLVYELGKEDLKNNKYIEEELSLYLEEYLKEQFEKNDFMHYREFVRLLRACTIDVGGEVSFEIKQMYNNFFLGKRLIKAYELGRFGKKAN